MRRNLPSLSVLNQAFAGRCQHADAEVLHLRLQYVRTGRRGDGALPLGYATKRVQKSLPIFQ